MINRQQLSNMAAEEVELGFVEEVSDDPGRSLQITSVFFPSKVGGKPAWLNQEDLPESELLLCGICQKPMIFLLQVYAPLSYERSFHRTIYLFCCKDGKCHSTGRKDCFLALRNQLGRKNKFYSFNPPPELDEMRELSLALVPEEFKPRNCTNLCNVCGCRGNKKCSKCHVAHYCSRDHQMIDWRSGHKALCSDLCEGKKQFLPDGEHKNKKSKVLFPEYDLVIETEPEESQCLERSEEDRLEDYTHFVKTNKLMNDAESDKDLELLANLNKEALLADKQFRKFKKRIQREPKQVLRYQRDGKPLWVATEGKICDEDIELCYCGANRVFEFQVMPQLLNHLQVDSLQDSVDWGTIAVYTCSQSCDNGNLYHIEFLWRQNFADTGIPGRSSTNSIN